MGLKKTFRDCCVNSCFGALAIYIAYQILFSFTDDRSLVLGIVAGASGVVAFAKGLFLTKHRFAMSLIAEMFLILGLVAGSVVALGFNQNALVAGKNQLVVFMFVFLVGFGVNLFSALLSKKFIGHSLSDW